MLAYGIAQTSKKTQMLYVCSATYKAMYGTRKEIEKNKVANWRNIVLFIFSSIGKDTDKQQPQTTEPSSCIIITIQLSVVVFSLLIIDNIAAFFVRHVSKQYTKNKGNSRHLLSPMLMSSF